MQGRNADEDFFKILEYSEFYFLCGVDPGIKCCAGCDSGISEIYEFIYL